MSNDKKTNTIKIKESELTEMLDKIVNEALVTKKKEWLAEQVAKGDKTAILETKLTELEGKLNKLVTESVKPEVKK